MIGDSLLLLAGLALLIAGGEGLVRGASQIAARLGIPPIVVGLTVVAFGTSTPELAVSVSAALKGSAGITFGNVVGSNIANIGLLLGITAILRPIQVHGQIVQREIPMMLLCSAAAIVLCLDTALHGGPNRLHRGDGVMLLLLFGVFLYYTAGEAFRNRHTDPPLADPLLADSILAGAPSAAAAPSGNSLVSVTFIVAGLAGLVFGGELVVNSAVAIARRFAISETAIGATIVAVGTSLPELVTCVVAARKGMHDLAIGNIVGSNIFNLLFVLGTTATIQPIDVPGGGWIDLVVMLFFAAALLPLALTHSRVVTRGEGIALIVGYGAYATWQVLH